MILETTHLLSLDENTVWLQANRNFGNMVPDLSSDWEMNRDKAIACIGAYTTASQVVRMKPRGVGGFIDLDLVEPAAMHLTDGFITTNPDFILHANPADCGEIALSGFSNTEERNVIGLFHASRRIVGEGGHLRAIDYLLETHDIDPATLNARLSPSARGESYRFSDIDQAQKTSPLWRDYVYEDSEGYWHVDFHQRTVDDLLNIGIPEENIIVCDGDTAADLAYFSYMRQAQGLEPRGANGLLFALR